MYKFLNNIDLTYSQLNILIDILRSLFLTLIFVVMAVIMFIYKLFNYEKFQDDYK